MTLGASYTTQLSTITNAMLAGSISLSKLAPGILGQIIIVNALGNAVYGSLSWVLVWPWWPEDAMLGF